VTALCSALIEGSVLDVQELVRSLHGGQGQETLSMATFELLLSPTSLGKIKTIGFIPIEALACRNILSAITVAKRATKGIPVTGWTGEFFEDCP